jgi:hypothetical protein
MGKQIRIYLADSSSSGVRHAEISNWTGQALACPRSRFQELRDWDEVRRPGVYFLFGSAEDTGEDAVYIGESEVVLDRLYTHMAGKEFWGEVVAFTSKDDNLTKGHVKFLESRLIQMAISAGRYRVTNSASPQLPALPRGDRDAMEEFLVSVRTLLGVLGHRVLEPYVEPSRPTTLPPDTDKAEGQRPVMGPADDQGRSNAHNIFVLHISDLKAKAMRTDEGIVVLSGSEAAVSPQSSLSVGYRTLREKLTSNGAFVRVGAKLQLARDQLFSSPSQAAAVLVGYSINGRDAWRLQDGTTYAAFEQKQSDQLLRELEEKP